MPSGEEQDKYAPTIWGAGAPEGYVDLEVPSGQLCLARRPGVTGLFKAGALLNVDSLTATIHSKYLDDGALTVESARRMLDDPEAIAAMTRVIDRVVCHVIVKPEIHMTPDDVTNRQRGVIYADTIDTTDKIFIFNWAVGGVRDLERFRSQLDAHVANLAPIQGMGMPPKRPPGRKGRAGGVVPGPSGNDLRERSRERSSGSRAAGA